MAVKVDEATYARQSESDWFNAMDSFGLTYQRLRFPFLTRVKQLVSPRILTTPIMDYLLR